jgi:hypothetical protein
MLALQDGISDHAARNVPLNPPNLSLGERDGVFAPIDSGSHPTHADFLHPRPLIFVASDSDEVKALFKERDAASVRLAATTIAHVDRNPEFEGFLDAYVELLILAEADCIVASNSQFSRVARDISLPTNGIGWRCYVEARDCRLPKS